ncbi:MAG: tRNA pseudouridine synthase A [Saprospiraceae bacterium]|nr:tRNA pseudouridine synthase A [Saprospiraceae bacterium]MBK6783305.1 tRNA pseudouridine synthase A [Saprospiraceae bacterium]MBK8081151.1 tRNA pseudouridine synthase A [Saprospiraceae bacterium]MBK8372855.1 tRNA pseudouridine synthase A [Saprospiraceae bacterium]MBK8549012.1 tRNA pseudouridine synthase A [Saprospiraceae bacterium]
MLTVRLHIKEDVLKRVLKSLRVFTSDEVEIINEDQIFLENQNYLQKEIKEIENGDAEFISHEGLETSLNESMVE